MCPGLMTTGTNSSSPSIFSKGFSRSISFSGFSCSDCFNCGCKIDVSDFQFNQNLSKLIQRAYLSLCQYSLALLTGQ